MNLVPDKMEHFNKDDSTVFSDEAMRRFLLGRLNSAEQSVFEKRLFADDSLEGRVRLAEFELADDYAFDRLNTAERELFEQKFLVSNGRKQKLSVSRALRDRFACDSEITTATLPSTVGERLKLLFGFSQPARKFAMGFAILLLLIGTVWLVVKEPRIKEQIRQGIIARGSPSPTSPRKADHPADESQPVHQTSPAPVPDHEPKAPAIPTPATGSIRPEAGSSSVVANLVLFPDNSRDKTKIPFVNLPKSEQGMVRLQLTLNQNQSGPYRAELLTVAGQSVFTGEQLRPAAPDNSKTDFEIPARVLKTGDYQIKLSRANDGSKESLASYYFRVQ